MTDHPSPLTAPFRGAPGIAGRIRRRVGDTVDRCRTDIAACLWGGFVGVAPHLFHYSAPLLGTALVAGVGGRLLFGVLGFIVTLPILWRLHRREGGWRAPARALAVFVAIFALSTFVLGPFLVGATGSESPTAIPADGHGAHDG